MTIIRVVVESTLSGPLAGFHSLSIDDSETVQELINQYCVAKAGPLQPSYGLMTRNSVVLVNKHPLSQFFIADGEVLQLIMLRNTSVLVFRQWLTMSGIGMFVGIAGLISCVLLYVVFRNVPDNYAMVIDAGSTHTDMILYSWPGKKRNNTGEVTQVYSCSAPGGIAQVAPENISSYFDPCFHESYDAINEESRKSAEVLFGATAGMRLLNQTDSTTASQVISVVHSYITNSKWKHKPGNVGIISGSTEGVSGWITANFLEKTVLTKGDVNATFGALDLGGASTQISLEVEESLKDSPNVYPVTLFGNQYYVFSQSYLCHGVVQAMKRYRGLLMVEQATHNISSPCEPKGKNLTLSSSYFSTVCTDFLNMNDSSKWNLTIYGTGHYAECQRIVSKLLNYTECTNAEMGHCLEPSQLPSDRTNRRYYAFAAFNYITQDTGIPPGASPGHVHRYLKDMCDYDVVQLGHVKSKSKNQKRKFEELCFEGQYMFTLLTKVYGFESDEEWSQIVFTNQVKESTLGWSLGYMVNATEEIGAGPSVPKLKVLPFSLLTVLFVLFVLLSIGFILHGFKVRKNSPGYQRRHQLLMDQELEKFIQVASAHSDSD